MEKKGESGTFLHSKEEKKDTADTSHAIFQETSIFNGRIPLQVGMQAIALAARLIGCGLSSTGGFLLVPDGTSCTLPPFARRAFASDTGRKQAVFKYQKSLFPAVLEIGFVAKGRCVILLG